MKTPVDLRKVIDNAVRFSLSGSSADCQVADSADLWQVEADEGQISQVIQNVVLNADQSMPRGGRIDISTRNLAAADPRLPGGLKEGRYVELVIRDAGCGIAEQDLPRIFDPYFTTKKKGSGLGLATSYSIIKNHGGLIRVESSLGEGSAFFMYLPASDTVSSREEKPKQELPETTRPGKILVMDDEAMICQVAQAMINGMGHQAEVAMNGEEALVRYEAAREAGKPFDLVILDLTVRGGMGGEETLQNLLVIHPGVKAVVSSGYADSPIIADYRAYGFTAFLNKPYTRECLRDLLHTILTGNGDGS